MNRHERRPNAALARRAGQAEVVAIRCDVEGCRATGAGVVVDAEGRRVAGLCAAHADRFEQMRQRAIDEARARELRRKPFRRALNWLVAVALYVAHFARTKVARLASRGSP